MMKKLTAAILAAATTLSVGVSAFAIPGLPPEVTVASIAKSWGMDYRWDAEEKVHHLSGEMDLGTFAVADLRVLTDDGLGHGNYVSTDVVLPGKTYYISSGLLTGRDYPIYGNTIIREEALLEVLKETLPKATKFSTVNTGRV